MIDQKKIRQFFYFSKYVLDKDPDILVCASNHFEYKNFLLERMSLLGLDLSPGRDEEQSTNNNTTNRITGRVYLSNNPVQKDLNLAGLIEKARFSFLPLSLATYGINRLIDSRNCYELIQRGLVIPDSYQYQHEQIRTVEEIITKDKGGMIFSPQIGLHQNVV